MPLYYFHVRGGQAPAEAEEGWEFADEAAALENARTAARELIASDVRDGILDLSGRIEVEDGQGNAIVTVPFSAVFRHY